MALSSGLPILLKKFSQCGADHLAQGVFAKKAYKKHMCTFFTMWIGKATGVGIGGLFSTEFAQ